MKQYCVVRMYWSDGEQYLGGVYGPFSSEAEVDKYVKSIDKEYHSEYHVEEMIT